MRIQVVCRVCVCVWRWLHLLALPILWQLSLITLRMDADLPLTSSGLETADNLEMFLLHKPLLK